MDYCAQHVLISSLFCAISVGRGRRLHCSSIIYCQIILYNMKIFKLYNLFTRVPRESYIVPKMPQKNRFQLDIFPFQPPWGFVNLESLFRLRGTCLEEEPE